MELKNYFILEYSFANNDLIAITLLEQIKANRDCLLNGIQHDYIPIMYFETKSELEIEAKFIQNKIKSKPMYLGIGGRIYVK